jgi:L-fucose isomerase-like protein
MYLNISPCVLLSVYNDFCLPAACEVDIGNAVSMYVLMQASGNPVACLDWNNNYGDDEDKCILFHCGPVPQSMMVDKGWINDHLIIRNAIGPDKGYGCNQGRIKPSKMTFASMRTAEGKPEFYVGEGKFTADPIDASFFGAAGVAEIPDLQEILLYICETGHRHHTSVTTDHVAEAVHEAITKYCGMNVDIL